MDAELFKTLCFIAFLSGVNSASVSDLKAAPFGNILKDIATGIGVDYVQQKYDDLPYSVDELDGQALINELSQQVRAKFDARMKIATGLRDAIEQKYASFSVSTNLQQCCYMSDYLEYDPSFGAKVDHTQLCYHVSGSSNSPDTTKKISNEIVQLMKDNLENNQNLKWQYFGSEEGGYFNYPAYKLSSCTEYDGRFRPWYVEAAVPKPNDVVIVIDKSGSMSSTHNGKTLMSIAIDAAKTVIGTLNPRDRVGLVTFSSSAETPPGKLDTDNCYATELAIATPQNTDYFKSYLDTSVSYGGTTDYVKALDKAFDLFLQTPSLEGERGKVMLFMSDGVPNNGRTDILNKIQSKNKQLQNKVIILTYGLGRSLAEAAQNILTEMMEQKNYDASFGNVTVGAFTLVTNPDNLRSEMATYYNLFSKQSEITDPIFSVPYVDTFSKALIFSVVLPVYHEGKLKGVTGTDMSMGDLLSEITYFKSGEFSYAFMIDGNGRTLMHPLLPRPYEVSEPPIFIDIDNLEPEASVAVEAMKRGESGSKSLTSKRSLARGNSKYEGVNSLSLPSHYYYAPIAGTHFSVCVVIADSDRQAMLPSTLKLDDSQEFLYHNLTLRQNSADTCKFFKRYASKKGACVKFSPFAFRKPYTYLDHVETQADVDSYGQYMKGGNSQLFKPSVRPAVGISAVVDDHWLKDSHSDITKFLVWRYFGTIEGVLRLYPAVTLAKTYDHTIRPWYKRVISHRGMNILSAPYDDAWGSGLLITYGRTVFQGKPGGGHDSKDLVAGVMGTDFTIGSFYSKMIEANSICSNDNYRCFVMDNSGYLVMHPDFVETEDIKNITDIHIIDKLPSVANHLISDGVLKRKACVNYESIAFNAYWTVDLTSRYEGKGQLALEYVENSNVYVGVYSTQLAHSAKCTCNDIYSRCSAQVFNSNSKDCECPCYTKAKYDYCDNQFDVNSDSWDICTPRTPEPEYSVDSEQSKIQDLERCIDKKCHDRTDKNNCFGVSGCRWCTKGVCIYQEESCLGLTGGEIAGLVIGIAFVVILIIVLCVCYCKKDKIKRWRNKRKNNHDSRNNQTSSGSQAYDNPQRVTDAPQPTAPYESLHYNNQGQITMAKSTSQPHYGEASHTATNLDLPPSYDQSTSENQIKIGLP